MLFLCLIISTIAMCNGNMMCMFEKYSYCYVDQTGELPNMYCTNGKHKIECWKEEAKKCGVENNTAVRDLITDFNEVCDDESVLNKVFKQHEECVFKVSTLARASGPCFQIMENIFAVENAPSQDKTGMIQVCKNANRFNDCIRTQVKEACGEEADQVHCKVLGPLNRIEDAACVEIGAIAGGGDTTCVFSGCVGIGNLKNMLFQIAAVIFTLTAGSAKKI